MDVSVFYSHVNYSVTKIHLVGQFLKYLFYSHVNYSVTKISPISISGFDTFTVT